MDISKKVRGVFLMFVLMMVLVSLSTSVTSRTCLPTLEDCGVKGRTCTSAGLCDNKKVGADCANNMICVEICNGAMFGNAAFACCGCVFTRSVSAYINQGLVTPKIASIGKASGHIADLTLTSNANEVLTLSIKPSGLEQMILLNPNEDEQDLVIARIPGVSIGPTTYRPADNVTIKPGESVTFPVEGYCVDMSKRNPTGGTKLTLGGLIDPNVQLVMDTLEYDIIPESFTPEDTHSFKQIAIWMSQPENVNNTPEDYAERGYPVKEEYKPTLKNILNQIGTNPEEIIALSGKKKESKPQEGSPWIYAAAAVVGILAIWGVYKILIKK